MDTAYSHPCALPRFSPGDIVEHKHLPGVPLVVVRRLPDGVGGAPRWEVRMPGGALESMYERNLIR